ncbi:MAG: hypothetical protein ACI4YB_02885 [Oscillospiraceae bacterium]
MSSMLNNWITLNKPKLENLGIIIDNIRNEDIGLNSNITSFDLQINTRLARISLNRQGRLYAHIISDISNETIFLFDDIISFNESELNGFLFCFIQILVG